MKQKSVLFFLPGYFKAHSAKSHDPPSKHCGGTATSEGQGGPFRVQGVGSGESGFRVLDLGFGFRESGFLK